MYQKVEQILLQYGYERIDLNAADIYLALRQEQGEGYVVVTVDETGGKKMNADELRHVSEQIRGFLQTRGCYHSRFLYLLISDDDDSAGRLFGNFDCFWRIVPARGQLMVFEEACEAYMELRVPLENLFAGSIRIGVRNRTLPWINIVIILINLVVFLFTDFFLAFSGGAVMDAGALGWRQVFADGQWYRMVSSMFLHNGGEHLFNNMLVLGYIGSCLELNIGRLRYGILYIGSGLLAGLTSMVYNMVQNAYTVSVGASGAIFGTVGAMLFLVLFHRGRKSKYSVRQIAWMAFLSLYGGFASQGIDHAAHFGGFAAGFVLAGFLTFGQRPER